MQQFEMPNLGMEIIDFQSGKLFQALTEAVNDLRVRGTYATEDIEDVDFHGIIKKHTGMFVTFTINKDYNNVGILVPTVDKNHPFIREVYREYVNSDGIQAIRLLGNKVKGSIDRKHCMVDGIYSKFEATLIMGLEYLKDKTFSNAEIAAFILHELGHLFSFFERLGHMFTTSVVMAYAAREVMTIDEPKKRVDVLVEAEHVLGIEIKDREKVATAAKEKRGTVVQTVILSAVAEKSRSELGTNIYDMRSCEQVADMFAVRHGAGKDLAIALAKMYKREVYTSTLSLTMYLSLELAKILMFIASLGIFIYAGAYIAAGSLIAMLIFTNPTLKIYDEPEARIKMIRKQVMEELKIPHLHKDRQKALLADIEAIEAAEILLKDRLSFWETIWTNVIPWQRKAVEQEVIHKQIEDLITNELFVHAAKFKTGASHV